MPQNPQTPTIRMELCARAAADYRYLLSRSYRPGPALEFIGNHFQLTRKERDMLFRAVCSPALAESRKAKSVSVNSLKGARLIVDGYNCLITLENAMHGRPLVQSDDGFIRDMERIFRKFRPTNHTKTAWAHISGLLSDFPPAYCLVFLDYSMKASGELAARIRRWLSDAGHRGTCCTVKCTEKRIAGLKGIKCSADSVIIDSADQVFDLSGFIIMNRLGIKPIRLPVDERHGVS